MDTTNVSAAIPEHNADIARFVPAPKSRSCIVCRGRRVRCDKAHPCSNCRKTNVECVYPVVDRRPKWVRRLEQNTKDIPSNAKPTKNGDGQVEQVMHRLQSLEGLVKDLSEQLARANSASPQAQDISSVESPEAISVHRGRELRGSSVTTSSSTAEQSGRLIVEDHNRSRYLSSAFWSKVNDEVSVTWKKPEERAANETQLDGLRMVTQNTEYESSSDDNDFANSRSTTQELSRTPLERHSFFFRHNLGSSFDIHEFQPLPSQIPFLLDTFAENVNYIVGVLHMPTVRKLVRDVRNEGSPVSAANEALLFSIYYAAVTSMEDDEVINNFGTTKTELNLRYRLGLEHALAKADFLNVPDLVLVQAFAIFLLLARRHDSPRFIWMMTGLLIRMAQSLGLQRDGSNFPGLNPYEVEMRRRLWWAICLLDIRASEDQAMDITIARDSFDTKLPSNISDADIDPGMKEAPIPQRNMTEVSAALTCYEMCQVAREMVAPGGKDGPPDLETQNRLIDTLYDKLDAGYLQLAGDAHRSACWMAEMSSRLVMAKMRLLIYLPLLFSSPDDQFSDELRNKLLIAAIEVAEYNHALNSEQSVRQWRWIYQVYTHWYSIVYLLMEVSRRPLLPTIERAWIALQSTWLIPSQSQLDRNNRHWIPLRKLMVQARKHREEEINRLRHEPGLAQRLEIQDKAFPAPSSTGPFPGNNSTELFLNHWRNLVSVDPTASTSSANTFDMSSNQLSQPKISALDTNTPSIQSNANLIPTEPNLIVPAEWTSGQESGPESMSWLWNEITTTETANLDLDMDMAFDSNTNWQDWLDATKDLA